MITDSQIKEEAFLEDIDSLLNTGEVANLYAVDEKQELIEAIRPVLAGKYGKDREFTPLGWFSSAFFDLNELLRTLLVTSLSFQLHVLIESFI